MSTTVHNLRLNGAPYTDKGEQVHTDPKVTAGEGRGRCTCGTMSEVLPNGASRRRWHKWHKENELQAAPVQEELAVSAAPAKEAPVVEKAPKEKTVTKKAAPKKAAPKKTEAAPKKTEKAAALEPGHNSGTNDVEDLIGVPKRHAVLEYDESGMAHHFWSQLGVKASTGYLANHFPEVELQADAKAMKLHFYHPDADTVLAAVEGVQDMWAAAKPAFRDWKKTNADYAALDHTQKADRSKSYFLVRDFFIEFGKTYSPAAAA